MLIKSQTLRIVQYENDSKPGIDEQSRKKNASQPSRRPGLINMDNLRRLLQHRPEKRPEPTAHLQLLHLGSLAAAARQATLEGEIISFSSIGTIIIIITIIILLSLLLL
jgi:hypothetical protein